MVSNYLEYTLFYIRIYFIRISRLKFAKFFKNILRINPRLRFCIEKDMFVMNGACNTYMYSHSTKEMN